MRPRAFHGTMTNAPRSLHVRPSHASWLEADDKKTNVQKTKEIGMTLKQLRIAALAATFLAGSAALGYAQSSSTVGAGGSSAGGGTSSTTLGTGGSSAGGSAGAGSSSTLGVGGS